MTAPTPPPENENARAGTRALDTKTTFDKIDSTPTLKAEQAYGATPEEWRHLSVVLGLTADLLPVVSNPKATISPDSKMKQLGKTPSRYNKDGHVAGIAGWTDYQATTNDVRAWSEQPDYGICIQTRRVRALDIDIDDVEAARAIWVTISDAFGYVPLRRRANSGKCLVAFTLEGGFTKRSFRITGGIVEFLADGQQFVACGTHPSGVRYEWPNGLPDEFPTITTEQFEALWSSLVETFATGVPSERKATTKAATLQAAASRDAVAAILYERSLVLSAGSDGRLNVTCPFASEHTTDSAESATTYFPAHTGGYARGHWHCLHAHCEGRSDAEFNAAIGYTEGLEDFGVVAPGEEVATVNGAPLRFQVIPAREFTQQAPLDWIVKGVLLKAALAVVFGDSGAGKSFLVFDMIAAIARGEPWRDRKVKQGGCVYIAAEGAQGFRNRIKAYQLHHAIEQLNIGVIADAPDLSKMADVRDLIASINAFGPVSVVVIDTLARTLGGDENSGEHMGRAVKHCADIHQHTGALVVLVHHSGKQADRGARGHSSLRAAADIEIEVTRCVDDRIARITKLKDGGREGEEFGFKLHTVVVGQDDDGEAITSCVLEHGVAVPRALRKRAIKGINEQLVLSVLDSLIGLDGTGPYLETLKLACVARMVAPDKGRTDRRRDLIAKAITTLTLAGHISQQDGSVVRLGGKYAQ